MQDDRPLSVDQIAEMIPDGTFDARRARVTRAIHDGSLPGAFKVNPRRETSPWLVPAATARKWLANPEPTPDETKE